MSRQELKSLLDACIELLADGHGIALNVEPKHWDQALKLLSGWSLPSFEQWRLDHQSDVGIAATVADQQEIPTLMAVVAAVGLTTDRYRLCDRWSKHAFWSDLEILAAALCQRLPAMS